MLYDIYVSRAGDSESSTAHGPEFVIHGSCALEAIYNFLSNYEVAPDVDELAAGDDDSNAYACRVGPSEWEVHVQFDNVDQSFVYDTATA